MDGFRSGSRHPDDSDRLDSHATTGIAACYLATMAAKQQMVSSCKCGSVELVASGAPILSSACYCDDCVKGAQVVEDLPGAPWYASPMAGRPISSTGRTASPA